MKFLMVLLFPFLLSAGVYFEGGKMSLEDLAITVSIETDKDIILHESLREKFVYLRVGKVVPKERLLSYFFSLIEANGLAINKKDNFYIVTPLPDLEYFEYKFKNVVSDDFKTHMDFFKNLCTLSKDFVFCSATAKDILRIKKMVQTFDVAPDVDPFENKTLDIRLKIMESSYADILDLKNSLTFGVDTKYAKADFSVSDTVSTALNLFLNRSNVLDTLSVSYVFDFLEKNGISSVVNEPNILVTNGAETSINTGGTQRVVRSISNNDDLSKETKTYDIFVTGLQLKIKAFILSDTKFKLEISLNNEDVVGGTAELPITSKQSYSTSISLDKNETVVLGGVIYDKHSKDNYKVPFLGDIPLLGIPFNTTSENKEKKVLSIALTVKDFK